MCDFLGEKGRICIKVVFEVSKQMKKKSKGK